MAEAGSKPWLLAGSTPLPWSVLSCPLSSQGFLTHPSWVWLHPLTQISLLPFQSWTSTIVSPLASSHQCSGNYVESDVDLLSGAEILCWWLLANYHHHPGITVIIQGNRIWHGAGCTHLGAQLSPLVSRAVAPRAGCQCHLPVPSPAELLTDQGSRLLYLPLTPAPLPRLLYLGVSWWLMKNPCVILRSCQLLLLGIKSSLQGGVRSAGWNNLFYMSSLSSIIRGDQVGPSLTACTQTNNRPY